MSNVLITTKAALNNLSTQAAGVKGASLSLTAAIIMTFIAYGEERADEGREAVRLALITAGFLKMDKGTKQPSDKARGFIKAAEGAVKFHGDKVRSIMSKGSDASAQTLAVATFIGTFALSNNHYEGGAYLMPLATGKSKAKCREIIKARHDGDAAEVEADDADITKEGKAEKASKAKDDAEAKGILTTAASVEGVLAAIGRMVHVKKGAKPSNVTSAAVVRLFSELDTVCRLIRGETVQNASKDSRKLAVEVAKHLSTFKTNARKVAKNKDAIASKKAA